MSFTFKEIILGLYIFLAIIFNISYSYTDENFVLNDSFYYQANFFYFLSLILISIIRNKDQILLLIPLYYSIYFGQRLIFLLGEDPKLRYFFLNQDDFNSAIIFINCSIIILIICTMIYRLIGKDIKLNIRNI